jgi:hypothetical protein
MRRVYNADQRWKNILITIISGETAKMRGLSRYILMLLLFLGVTIGQSVAAFSEDFLAGTVLAVDNEKMEIRLIPVSQAGSINDHEQNASVTIRYSTDSLVINKRGAYVLPGCVYPGGMIRVWGQMDNTGKIFLATDIRGYRGRGHFDPTGVRRRLHKMGPWNCPLGPGQGREE